MLMRSLDMAFVFNIAVTVMKRVLYKWSLSYNPIAAFEGLFDN